MNSKMQRPRIAENFINASGRAIRFVVTLWLGIKGNITNKNAMAIANTTLFRLQKRVRSAIINTLYYFHHLCQQIASKIRLTCVVKSRYFYTSTLGGLYYWTFGICFIDSEIAAAVSVCLSVGRLVCSVGWFGTRCIWPVFQIVVVLCINSAPFDCCFDSYVSAHVHESVRPLQFQLICVIVQH